MRILYFGGQKSGKSTLAEKKALELSDSKPYYIATYNNSFNDNEMAKRIEKHRLQREDSFITIEEQNNLIKVIEDNNTYLIDCISMWLLNNIENSEEFLLKQIDTICKTNANIIFVLNDVNSGVIPIDNISRQFVDLTGIIGQKIALMCNEVYEVKFGLENRLK
jgi:adenosylcobinamide kinase/adenosylcobinamide-phosphate guanylyltransferase